MTTDLTTTPDAAELAKIEDELTQKALAKIDRSKMRPPMIVLAQQTTREVQNDEIESGVWLNKVTGENLGEEIELVIGDYYVGRFYSPDNEDRVYNAQGPVAPADWPEGIAGKNFADLPQAEEQWKARSNDPEDDFQWGSGPEIETTHNFLGFLTNYPDVIVRVSLKTTSTPAAEKVNNIVTFAGSYWANSFRFGIDRRTNKKDQPYYVATVKKGEQTTPEQRTKALEIAYLADKARISLDDPEPNAAPAKAKPAEKPAGAADVV